MTWTGCNLLMSILQVFPPGNPQAVVLLSSNALVIDFRLVSLDAIHNSGGPNIEYQCPNAGGTDSAACSCTWFFICDEVSKAASARPGAPAHSVFLQRSMRWTVDQAKPPPPPSLPEPSKPRVFTNCPSPNLHTW